MTASKFIVLPILTCVLLLIDWYVWQAVKTIIISNSNQVQGIVKYSYWIFTTMILFGLWAYNFLDPKVLGTGLRTWILSSIFVVYGSKLFSIIFLVIDDGLRLIRWWKEELSTSKESPQDNMITRSEFLMKTALVAASIPAVALTWGIVSGAHDYRKRHVRLAIKNLPKEFEGIRIGQISDIHSGSFFNKVAVKGGVEMLMREKPDMIFFTGDLVNDIASEVNEYIDIFSKIKAPLGVYSTLGNHDYGAYKGWRTSKEKDQNLKDVMHAHKLLGYDLLVDENRIIAMGGEKLAILGVQNISAKESIFPNTGNMSRALRGSNVASVKLLLSHDPTHWDLEVNRKFTDIDVMFSGHTHGLQMGITVGDQTYSPAQWQYKQWGGLYRKGEQQLYVNRGFGYLGYPGRVAMPPEITIFQLTRA